MDEIRRVERFFKCFLFQYEIYNVDERAKKNKREK